MIIACSCPPLQQNQEVKKEVPPINKTQPIITLLPQKSVPGSILRVKIQFDDLSGQQAKKKDAPNDLPSLLFHEKNYPFFEVKPQVFEALIGIPYDQEVGETNLFLQYFDSTLDEYQKIDLPLKIVAGDYALEILTVAPDKVAPQKLADLKRIHEEAALVGKIYHTITNQVGFQGGFQLPLKSPITSPFGTRRIYNNGKLKNFHTGTDFKAPIGTQISTSSGGWVVLAQDLFFTGNTVIVDHGYGILTLYAHLSRLKVKKGDPVTAGKIIGLSGATGRVNGPHLHWQCVIQGVKVNPLGLVSTSAQDL